MVQDGLTKQPKMAYDVVQDGLGKQPKMAYDAAQDGLLNSLKFPQKLNLTQIFSRIEIIKQGPSSND